MSEFKPARPLTAAWAKAALGVHAQEKREAEAHRKARKIVERYLRRAETEIDAAGRLQDDIANAIVRAMERAGA